MSSDLANSASNSDVSSSSSTLTDRQRIDAELFIKENAASYGLVYSANRYKTPPLPIGIAVLPALLPAPCHRFAYDLQSQWITLVHRLSADDRFIESTLERVAVVDAFVEHQMHVYRETRQSSLNQLSLCLLRIDYMQEGDDMKLVEITPEAAGLAGWSVPLALLQSRLASSVKLAQYERLLTDADAAKTFADGLAVAYTHYRERLGRRDVDARPPPIILTIVAIEYLSDFVQIAKHITQIPLTHCTIEQATRHCRVDEDGILFFHLSEVAIVYSRINPLRYEGHWDTRLLIERSLAVKCPSIRQSLMGTKTVQQALSAPNVIEQFASAQQLRRTFVGHFPLSDRLAVERAIKQPHRFVLKPNRDGGGNNFFNNSLHTKLESIAGRPEADAYTLMQRIDAPTQHNVLVFGDGHASVCGETSNEFSYFGVVLGTGSGEVLYRKAARQPMARAKRADKDECGMQTGYTAVSSVALV